jgi:hypothetical protein
MRESLSNALTLLIALALVLVMSSCASAPSSQPAEPAESEGTETTAESSAETAETAEASAEPVVTEFGNAWGNAEVRVEAGNPHELGGKRIVAGFECVWTDGQEAGVAYPQRFVSQDSGQEVPMEFTWDSGGKIAQGVYDVLVEVDGRAGTGWIRDLPLTGARQLRVVLDLNACQLTLPLDTYRQVIVYPEGTYEDFESRNMLDAIPEDIELSRYDEYHRGQWAVAPSGVFDLKVTYTDGTTEWLESHELPENARVNEL